MLAKVEPRLQPLLDGVVNNRNEWQALADAREKELKEEQEQAEKAGTTGEASKPAQPKQEQKQVTTGQ